MTETVPEPASLIRLVKSMLAIPDPNLHQTPIARYLAETEVSELVEGLRDVITDLERAGYRAAYHALVEYLVHGDGARKIRVEAIYRAAHAVHYTPVKTLLLRAPPQKVADPRDVIPDPELLDMPLGRRKALAKGTIRDMLTRLAMDPSTPVVQLLLQNRRFTEADVVRIAARRPNLSDVLRTVAAHPRWSHKYAVQMAVIQNPYSPAYVSAALVPFLRGRHLGDVTRDARLHNMVREVAQMVSEWRRDRRRPSVTVH